jgi:ELP3 family radical SAM enzyme/protein acetyltransferase
MDDIENIVKDEKLKKFANELFKYEFNSNNDYVKNYDILKKKYKLCPNKPTLNKLYFKLLKNGEIKENTSFLQYSLKKKVRSSSGVSVITILTSPNPSFIDENGEMVIQEFSCRHDCAYCPNEPSVKLTLKIERIDDNCKFMVSSSDDLKVIRLLTYIIYNDNQYKVNHCDLFSENTFRVELKGALPDFSVGDTIIGVKGEQPRSYLSTEPAVLRANRNGFDAVLQIYDRSNALTNCGHIVDKIEMLVLGGTWDNYPQQYQESFIRDIYYAGNTVDNTSRDKLTLEEEIKIAETSKKRIIGLTLETRPEYLIPRQIRRMRRFNVTRLQIGVQHIDDEVLEYIDRGCNLNQIIRGNDVWKKNGGKVDWHLMPDLPGSSKERDLAMFGKIFGIKSITEIHKNYIKYDLLHPELQADQLKIYPCSVVDWTKIKEWYENGTYKPYSENKEDLIEVLAFIKTNVFPWIRINRIIRDIPNMNIIGGNKDVNLHQKLIDRKDIISNDIRSREVGRNPGDIEKAELVIREYNGVESTEYFISYESPDKRTLYGFLRLRINDNNTDIIYNELEDCSFIRELHVYGSIVGHSSKKGSVQHMGFGKKMMKVAEDISQARGFNRVAVISGVGVRGYYASQDYKLVKDYMIKELEDNEIYNDRYFLFAIILTIILLLIFI